jgi:hypothetical protein
MSSCKRLRAQKEKADGEEVSIGLGVGSAYAPRTIDVCASAADKAVSSEATKVKSAASTALLVSA